MKLKIKVRVWDNVCTPVISENGDWIDLRSAQDMDIYAPQSGVQYQKDNIKYRDVNIPVVYIPLGVAMKLPDGFEAIVASRSGTPSKIGLFIPNGQGVIDNSYSGNDDQWHYVCSPLRNVTINKGDRICQFRIQLSQKATIWQKIKWLLSSGIEIEIVDKLDDNNRGMNVTGIE